MYGEQISRDFLIFFVAESLALAVDFNQPFQGAAVFCKEQSGRRCFAMDSDPLNCDLTVLRWEQFTGEKARRMKKYV